MTRKRRVKAVLAAFRSGAILMNQADCEVLKNTVVENVSVLSADKLLEAAAIPLYESNLNQGVETMSFHEQCDLYVYASGVAKSGIGMR